MYKNIKKIVLTGGPCGGKTTALGYVSEELKKMGFKVFQVPEIATMFISGGVSDITDISQTDYEKYLEIEKRMILAQIALEKEFYDLSNIFQDEKRVIIFDRGVMDMAAYIPQEHFEKIISEIGLDIESILSNYDGVIHLVTAANGAENFYNTKNNKARVENSIEEARLADERTLQAWARHPNLKIIDNSTDFENKMQRLLKEITELIR
jgi:predicted ATPase